jgi:molybdopterin synthase catalytic subunit
MAGMNAPVQTPVIVKVQEAPFDVAAEYAAFRADVRCGAVVSFTGIVREHGGDARIAAMTLEHYPGMTERAIAEICEEACRRWPLKKVLAIHRHGRLRPDEDIVLVITAADHRRDAFEAAQFLMDWLKTKAPFWKLEETEKGARWVEAKSADDEAAARWEKA